VVADYHKVVKVVDALHRGLRGRKERGRLAPNVDKSTALLVLHHLTNHDVANLLERPWIANKYSTPDNVQHALFFAPGKRLCNSWNHRRTKSMPDAYY